MTKEQFVAWADGASQEQLADFNNNSEPVIFNEGGDGETDGAEKAEIYLNFSSQDKDWIKTNGSKFGVKDPC